jgi:hypothetical protein
MVSAARLCVPSTSVVGARCDRIPTVNTRSAQELLAPLATQQTDLGARLDTLGRALDLVRLLDSGPATPPVMP